ncbi:MAG: Cell division protein ftsA [Parcubacteria group bacterium GW2011_GWF2_38_8]|nr:MAG: Cell division protein ftsA [Parcubacteria group bacterium GW2011_GWF2_38_8]
MIRNISIGIDLGSSRTKVVVAEFLRGEKNPKIIGVGESETKGVRHGYIVNMPLAITSIKNAVLLAEKSSDIKIKRAFISIGGLTLRSETISGTGIVSKVDSEVTKLDINKTLDDSEDNLNLNNKKIIEAIPISFKLDGKEVLGRPEGMKGTKLEVKTLFVTCSIPHWEDLLEAVALAGVEPVNVIASSMAESRLVLSEKQKIVGVALANIGSETVSLSVFENGLLTSLHTFSIGGADITNDIALGLKISLENAEKFKLGNITPDYPKKKLDEIIEARLSDIFELIENYLKKIKRNELLPAGIVFTGGSANIPSLEEFSKSALKLPSRIGETEIFGNIKTKLRDPSWFTALGLVMGNNIDNSDLYFENSLKNFLKNVKNAVRSGVKQLMP